MIYNLNFTLIFIEVFK